MVNVIKRFYDVLKIDQTASASSGVAIGHAGHTEHD